MASLSHGFTSCLASKHIHACWKPVRTWSIAIKNPLNSEQYSADENASFNPNISWGPVNWSCATCVQNFGNQNYTTHSLFHFFNSGFRLVRNVPLRSPDRYAPLQVLYENSPHRAFWSTFYDHFCKLTRFTSGNYKPSMPLGNSEIF